MMKNKSVLIIISLIIFGMSFNTALAADMPDSFMQDAGVLKNDFVNNDKSIKSKLSKKKDKKKTETGDEDISKGVTKINIDSDTIEYFPERKEIEAVGNAVITLPENGSTLSADKLIFNQDTAVLTGHGNVRLTRATQVLDGEFIRINLNEDNALLDKPISENQFFTLRAEVANLKGKDIFMENGILKMKSDERVAIGTGSFSQFVDPQLREVPKTFYLKEKYNDQYTLKAKEIIIDSTKDHDVIYAKNADLYMKEMKVQSSGLIKLITDKKQQYVETNIPEIGFLKQVGMYVGPGYAFEAPFGGSLKVTPFFGVYKSDPGVGIMGRYRNSRNVTEGAITTSDGAKSVLRGVHEISDNLNFEYSVNGYMSEGFFGDRVPGKLAQLVYNKNYDVEDIGVRFQQRFTAGVVQDLNSDWSTARFRWQAQADKPIWTYADDKRDIYHSLDISTQAFTTLYGNGDTVGIARFGPKFRTETNRWIQTIGYYYAAIHGDSPMYFDKYMYGRSNVYLSEALKLNKYVSAMWSTSISLEKDAWDGKLVQENRFFVYAGPDDMKFMLGYDTVRQRTFFNCSLLIGTKNSQLDFEKLHMKNYDKLGKEDKKNKKNQTTVQNNSAV